MLSVFPNLLNYWLAAPVILRAMLGLVLLHEAYAARRTERVSAAIKLLTGVCLFIGFLTQIGALAAAALSLRELWRQGTTDQRLLKLGIAVSLLFLGPGFFSLDWPL